MKWLTLPILALALSACAPFKPVDKHAGVCNQLNSALIFNGSAADMRNANIQNAETPLIQRSYEKNNCDT